MTDIYELFKNEIWQPEDNTEFVWFASCDAVHYNKEDNIDDLFNGDGETYSYEICEEYVKDNHVLYELRDYCGGTFQAIFSLDKIQDEDAYWESQEDGE